MTTELISEPTETVEPITFHIHDRGSADWYLKQIAAIDAEIVLLRSQTEQAIQRLQSERTGLENRFGSELEMWTRQQIEANPRGKKSVILPHGTCAFRTVPAGVRMVDEDAALQWAICDAPALVTTVTKLDTTGLRKLAEEYLQSTGELIPGVEAVDERQSFSIKFGGKQDG